MSAEVIILRDEIPNLMASLQDKLNEAMYEVGERIYDTAYDLVPVRTGNLRRSLFVQKEQDGSVGVGATAEYASYVEQGTSRQHAEPYLMPAYEQHKDEVIGLLWRAIGGGLTD